MPASFSAPCASSVEPDEGRWVRRGQALIGGLAVFRLLWLWLMPLDLIADEAYYWDWGRHPAWCYFSKPPMIAWLNTITQSIGFTTTSLQRVPSVVLGTVGLTAIWLLARRLWGGRAGFFAVVIAGTAPGSVALNSLLTIDAPLIAFWSVALYALWRALEPATESNGPAGRTRWWILYAVAGLLGVLSKQMMMVLPLLALGFVITSPTDRAWLRRPSFYVWLLIPFLALVPIIQWNIHHDWITAQHTAHHFKADPWRLSSSLAFVAEYIGSQLGLAGPVAASIAVVAAFGWREVRADRSRWFAWMMCAPGLLAIGALSFHQSINPNWPAVFHLGGLLLATGWLANDWPRRRKAWRATWITGATLATLGYGFIALSGPLGLHEHDQLDVTRRLRGWADLGKDVGVWKARLDADGGPPVIVISHGGRNLASELAFYLPGQPQIWHWTAPGVVSSQYALWPGPLPARTGMRALLVSSSDTLPAGLTDGFDRIIPLGEVAGKPGSGAPKRVWLWVGENLHSWAHGKPLE
ncbi:MAG: glycosyltransferase family 39 protein [Opitutaceae bacterium]|jgi:hypothetical protein